jgi:hypothetical protein
MILVSINLREVLGHPLLDKIYQQLSANGVLIYPTKQKWIESLLKNYRKTFHKEYDLDEVRFDIKPNQVYINQQIRFEDDVYYSLIIPHKLDNNKNKYLLRDKNIKEELHIRLFVVNGVLKLQLGIFTKEYSPNILRDGYQPVYQEFYTITSFPLYYFVALPEKYMSLSPDATDSYLKQYDNLQKKDLWKDWRNLHKELRTLYFIRTADNIISFFKIDKLLEIFEKKRNDWLKLEKFENNNIHEPGLLMNDPGRGDIAYSNKYLDLRIVDLNERKEWRARNTWTDYSSPY